MNNYEYNEGIRTLAADMVTEVMQETDNNREEAEEIINDSRLHETIDGHEWIIYYAYNDDVLRFSDNDEAYKDIYCDEDLGRLISEGGLDSAKTMMAFWAMYQDVQEQLDEAFDDYEEEQAA